MAGEQGTRRKSNDAIDAVTIAAGQVLGMGYAQTNANTSLEIGIPEDDTIPQQTEGTEVLTLNYTPKSPTSLLIITATTALGEISNGTNNLHGAIFVDNQQDAIGASFCQGFSNDLPSISYDSMTIRTAITSGNINTKTFKLRLGGGENQAPNVVKMHGTAGNARVFGGALFTSLQIMEIEQV